MNTISFRLSEELKKAIQGQAKLENKSVTDFIIDTLKEKLEDEQDYKLALNAYNSVDLSDETTLADLCFEAGIEYNEL